MANYRVSYKVLRQAGEDMKAVAKLLDGYGEKVTQIRGRLGNDDLLAQVRNNLQKLKEQLAEQRTILNVAGELLVKTVESYTGTEARQVKKSSGMRSHNRDFYKNPVTVATAGGAAAGAAAATPTMTYTDNSINTNILYQEGVSAPVADTPVSASEPVTVSTAASGSTGGASPVAATVEASKGAGGAAVAAAALGGAAATGAAIGGVQMKKKKDAEKAEEAARKAAELDAYDPELELEQALQRVRELSEEGN